MDHSLTRPDPFRCPHRLTQPHRTRRVPRAGRGSNRRPAGPGQDHPESEPVPIGQAGRTPTAGRRRSRPGWGLRRAHSARRERAGPTRVRHPPTAGRRSVSHPAPSAAGSGRLGRAWIPPVSRYGRQARVHRPACRPAGRTRRPSASSQNLRRASGLRSPGRQDRQDRRWIIRASPRCHSSRTRKRPAWSGCRHLGRRSAARSRRYRRPAGRPRYRPRRTTRLQRSTSRSTRRRPHPRPDTPHPNSRATLPRHSRAIPPRHSGAIPPCRTSRATPQRSGTATRHRPSRPTRHRVGPPTRPHPRLRSSPDGGRAGHRSRLPRWGYGRR